MKPGLIIFLLVIAVQAISAIIAYRKKQQEKLAKAEVARRIAMQRAGGPIGEPGMSEVATRQSATQPTASSDLEQRRREQLEQLRQRRQGRKPAAAQIRMPTPVAPRSRTPIIVATTMGVSDQARTAAHESAKQAKELERQRRNEQSRLATQMQDAQDAAARANYERTFHRVAGEADAQAHGVSRVDPTPPTVALSSARMAANTISSSDLIALLHDPNRVRQAMVLREVLDRPIGLR